MDYRSAPRYHDTLQSLLGEEDKTSLKVQTCGLGARRVDCEDDTTFNLAHSRYVPLMCLRRTCPECSWRDMIARIFQFRPISEISWWHHKDPDWQVRFWTLTCRAARPGSDLRPYISGLKKALDSTWRQLFGDHSPAGGDCYRLRGGSRPLNDAGGVFFCEVQGGWNPHFHGLVLSPYVRVERIRAIWSKALEVYGLSGNEILLEKQYITEKVDGKRVRRPCICLEDYRRALFEIVSYPVKPDKSGRHDQVLLAHVEAALKGVNRYIVKGAWYSYFQRPHRSGVCPECLGKLTHHDHVDTIIPGTRQNFFTPDAEGLANWLEFGYHFPKEELERMQHDFPSRESLS